MNGHHIPHHGSNAVPNDAIAVEQILESMGITEYEPRVVQQFLELIYRYVNDVFEDGKVYMEHAGRSTLDLEDARLAIQSRVNYSFTEPPPVEFLLEVANKRNSQPLPMLPEIPTVLLPPEQYCLSTPNYQITGQKPHHHHHHQQPPQQQQQPPQPPPQQQPQPQQQGGHQGGGGSGMPMDMSS